ncbi:hypothetical protein BDR04DRAFT_1098870, partial [Suillus decipiens]
KVVADTNGDAHVRLSSSDTLCTDLRTNKSYPHPSIHLSTLHRTSYPILPRHKADTCQTPCNDKLPRPIGNYVALSQLILDPAYSSQPVEYSPRYVTHILWNILTSQTPAKLDSYELEF